MANLRYGLLRYGRYRWAEPITTAGGGDGGGVLPDDQINYLPNVYTIIAYNKDGTKTAIFGAGSESNSIEKLNFEIAETGCGKVEMTFNKLPDNTALDYRQRVDIHLFNDPRPWYSGYIITRPVEGTTEETYKFTGYGYYNLLNKVIVTGTYENMEVSAIAAEIARLIERNVGLAFNSNKIVNTAYTIKKIEFDHVTAAEALKQLLNFALDYVCGVDEYRQLYFQPRNSEINEQARFWVSQHLKSYKPTWDVDKIVNHAYIKGATVDQQGEQWLAEVSDQESIELYGISETVWSLPSAYSADDAERWGKNQIEKYKTPRKSASVGGVKLDYPRADGSFFVRKLSTQGQTAITTLDGVLHTYPITKLKYSISNKDGIKLDMNVGEPPFALDKYFAELDRNAKMAELLQQASTKQLKTGGQ